jgi:hypothetical protein
MNNDVVFHSLSVDNFFRNPDFIREWGLSLDFKPDAIGNWPGERSKLISDIDLDLNNFILSKIFSCHLNLNLEKIKWKESSITFQKIKKFSNAKDDIKNIGWIHKDYDFNFAGLIYLTPNMNINSGTSLYNLKKEFENKGNSLYYDQKVKLYKDKEYNEKMYKKQLLLNNNMFVEKTRYFNIYNRMISYDANEYHGANNFYNETDDERLTMVFFVRDISFTEEPSLKKFYNNNHITDENIESKIRSL